ncbi:centrosomal protein of 55 kDa isoform X2 [Bufo gargarizans]|uniref:centrosomal protein of 55 kDa isoform X2 n=1 Tax=Bufo gargarizans TaxID=30331 RepID=UPI001CF3560D|nr:centrosomal protein of 55 kDa isoform X2 [Bufo gargarizans]
MNSRNGTNGRPGPKTAVPKSDSDLEKLKKENAILRKKLEESNKSKLSGAERNRLLENPTKADNASSMQIVEAQLQDALVKNRQWLVYDQQREAYVQGLMARIVDLERQVVNAQQSQQATESNSDAKEDKQKYYDRLMLAAKKDLEGERQITSQLNSELSELRLKYEEKKKELENVSATLKSLQESEKGQREDERRRFKEKMRQLKYEVDLYREKYEEEKKKNFDLSNQIQRCTADLENGKIDQQNVQQQLNKVLKELRKTREQITKLEPAKRDIYFVDTSGNFASDFSDKLSLREEQPSPKLKNVLDESFLECPRCRVVYPTSQHRELLAHLDFCTS